LSISSEKSPPRKNRRVWYCCTIYAWERHIDAIAEKLDKKLQRWEAATGEEVRPRLAEIIELADHDALDLLRSRVVEQQVLDTLDEPTTR